MINKGATPVLMQTTDVMAIDRADLIGILTLRFGSIPDSVTNAIEQIDNPDTLERLILVAANVPEWKTFVTELNTGGSAFKIVGEVYNPVPSTNIPASKAPINPSTKKEA